LIKFDPLIFKDRFKLDEKTILTNIHTKIMSKFNESSLNKIVLNTDRDKFRSTITTNEINLDTLTFTNNSTSHNSIEIQDSLNSNHSSIVMQSHNLHSSQLNQQNDLPNEQLDYLIKQNELLTSQNQLLNQQLNNHNTNTLNINNSSSNSNQINNNIFRQDNFKNIIHDKVFYLMQKVLKLDHHLQIYDIHSKNSTTPPSLYYTDFPRPMFYDGKIKLRINS
jgi:hypothetical protein